MHRAASWFRFLPLNGSVARDCSRSMQDTEASLVLIYLRG